MNLDPSNLLTAINWKRAVANLQRRKWDRLDQDLGNHYRFCIYAPAVKESVEQRREAIELSIASLAERAWVLAQEHAGKDAPLIHSQVLMDMRWLRIEEEFASIFPHRFRAAHYLPIYQAGLIPCVVAAGSYRFSLDEPTRFFPSDDFKIEGA